MDFRFRKKISRLRRSGDSRRDEEDYPAAHGDLAGCRLGARHGRGRRPNRNVERLTVGDVAPAFTLRSRDGKRKVSLADFKGKKPVALVFGSYT